MEEFQSQKRVRSDKMGRGEGGIPEFRTPRTLPLDPPLQLECLSFVTHGEDLPEILDKTTAQESKKFTYGWYRFSPGSAWFLGVLSCPVVRAKSGKVSLGDVTVHGWVQDWLSRERLGTRDNKGSDVLSKMAKCGEVTYHPVSSLSSFSFSFSLSSSCFSSSSSSSSMDWNSLAWKSASSARFYMENQWQKKRQIMSRWNMIVRVSFLTRRLSAHNYATSFNYYNCLNAILTH